MKIFIIFSFITLILLGLFINPILVQASDICYVDEDGDEDGDGDMNNPYIDIEEALYKECEKVIIKNGIYKEDIVIGKYVEIVGEELNNVIIAGDVTMKDKSKITNLTIADGGIVVRSGADVEIENLNIKDTNVGISTTGEGAILIKKIQFYQNQKAISISEGRDIEIIESEIYDNDSNGIDIQTNVLGVIKDNIIRDNEGNGVLVLTGDDDLEIVNNEIRNNKLNGIVVKYDKQNGEFTGLSIKDNIISSNDDFGIVCDVASAANPGEDYWKKTVNLKENKFHSNDAGKFSEACRRANNKIQKTESIQNNVTQQKQKIVKQQKFQEQSEKEKALSVMQKEKKFKKLEQEGQKKEDAQIKMRDDLQQEAVLQKSVEDILNEVGVLYGADIVAKNVLKSRPRIFIFLIGPNYRELREMAESMSVYDEKIKSATAISEQVQNESVAKQINQDILVMKKKKKEILDTAIEYNEKFSLFGSFFKKNI